MTTAAIAQQEPDSEAFRFNRFFSDLTDRLPPVLVLEAIQGLRSWVFVTVFLIMTICLVVQTGFETINATLVKPLDAEIGVVLQQSLTLIFVIVLPLRALQAVSLQQQAGVLDMLRLTDLKAFGICLGKWLSLTAQTALLVSIILPFTMVRYFLSRVDVVWEVAFIMILFSMSVVLQAGVLAASAIRPWFLKGLVIFVFGLAAVSCFFSSVQTSLGPITAVVLWSLTFGVVLIALAIDLAALTIEPASKSRATLRLALPVVMFVLGLVLAASQIVQPCSPALPFIAITGLAVANSLLEGNARLDRWVAAPTHYVNLHHGKGSPSWPPPPVTQVSAPPPTPDFEKLKEQKKPPLGSLPSRPPPK